MARIIFLLFLATSTIIFSSDSNIKKDGKIYAFIVADTYDKDIAQ